MSRDTPSIRTVEPRDHAEAFGLICHHLDQQQRREQVDAFLEAVGSGEIPAEGLVGAYRDRQLVAATLWHVQPGRTAAVWPPRLVPGEPRATAEDLLGAVCESLHNRRVQIAQSLLEMADKADEAVLESQGFRHLADMLYLVCLGVEFPGQPPGGVLQFEPYRAENHQRLADTVEATYEQSLDCPDLDGVREIEAVLAGYRATGVFDPSRWLIARHQEEDVGCLLLADHPEHGNMELVYMGVAASQRGHRWGIEIARHAQWLTRQAGRKRLVLAVDAANGPAIRMYSSVGFQAWDRRRVYLKAFEPTT